MRKPYLHKKSASTSRERAVLKAELNCFEVLTERHGKELALEMMEVAGLYEFLAYCNKHGIEEGGKSITRPIHLTRGIKF